MITTLSSSKIPIYFATYDNSMHIIPATAHLWNKYFNQPITFLGYKPLSIISDKFNYVSLKPTRSSFKEWAKNIRQHLLTISDEFIVFTIDDNFLLDYANTELIDIAIKYMKEHSDVACCYGSVSVCYNNDDRKWDEKDKIILEGNNNGEGNNGEGNNNEKGKYIIYEGSKSRYHLVNLQPNIWRVSVLCQILNHDFDIYDFEVTGSNLMRQTQWKFIGVEYLNEHTYRKCLFPNMYYTACSEKRNPGKISVLGLKNTDVKELIELSYVDINRLVYGYHSSYAIPYSIFKGNFTMEQFEIELKSRNLIKNTPIQQLGTVSDSLLGFKTVLGPIYSI